MGQRSHSSSLTRAIRSRWQRSANTRYSSYDAREFDVQMLLRCSRRTGIRKYAKFLRFCRRRRYFGLLWNQANEFDAELKIHRRGIMSRESCNHIVVDLPSTVTVEMSPQHWRKQRTTASWCLHYCCNNWTVPATQRVFAEKNRRTARLLRWKSCAASSSTGCFGGAAVVNVTTQVRSRYAVARSQQLYKLALNSIEFRLYFSRC